MWKGVSGTFPSRSTATSQVWLAARRGRHKDHRHGSLSSRGLETLLPNIQSIPGAGLGWTGQPGLAAQEESQPQATQGWHHALPDIPVKTSWLLHLGERSPRKISSMFLSEAINTKKQRKRSQTEHSQAGRLREATLPSSGPEKGAPGRAILAGIIFPAKPGFARGKIPVFHR